MKKVYLLLVLCCMGLAAYAQTAASYSFSRTTGTYTSIAGASGTTSTTSISSDDASMTISIGFDFVYCGNTYTSVYPCSNGFLSLSGAGTSYSNESGIGSAAPNGGVGFLMPYWDDLNGSGSTAYYQTSGTSPNRVFTFQWANTSGTLWGSYTGSGNATFQVKLYESSGAIQFRYGTSSYSSHSGSIGIANSSSDFQCLSNQTSTSTTTSYSTSCNSSPSANTVMTWLPPPAITASPTTLTFTTSSGSTSSGMAIDITGVGFTSSPITVTAPSNFQVYNGSSWVSSYTITPASNGGLYIPSTTVQVRFIAPSSAGAYTGNLTFTGGGLSGATVGLTGNSTAPCSGTPTGGTSAMSPLAGNASTSFTATASGFTIAGGITYQWQSSSDNATWADVTGATTSAYTFSGLTATTYYRCNITCTTSGNTANGASCSASYLVASSCTPTAYYTTPTYYSATTCCSYRYVGTTGYPVIINGAGGTSISDASFASSGPGGHPMWYDNTSLGVNMFLGGSYSATMGSSNGTYMSGSIWIDFNDDGAFSNSTELVGGYDVTSPAPGSRPTPTITIPAGVTPGTHRMRVNSTYHGNNAPGASAYYPRYPLANPCPNSTPAPYVYYSDTRDYAVSIQVPPPVVTPSPSSLAFGSLVPGTTSGPSVVSLDGTYMSIGGTMTVTPPTDYEVSPDNINWYGPGTPYTFTYTSTAFYGSFSNILYVRFSPSATGTISGNIVVTGGGLSSGVNVAVTGNGASACSSTPTAGTATINGSSSASGNSSTGFTLNATGTSVAGGLTYQWQIAPVSTGTFVNIPGAVTIPYTYTGLAVNSIFRCVVTCPSVGTANTNTVSATFTLPSSSCTPTAYYTTSTYYSPTGSTSYRRYIGTTGYPVIIDGEAGGGSISDASYASSGPSGHPMWYDNSSSMSVTFNAGNSYTATMGSSTATYMCGSIWIDFNDDGVFSNTTELVGGYDGGSPAPGVRPTPTINIPADANPGTHRMRAEVNYHGNNAPGASGYYPRYPLMNPCPNSTPSPYVYYADTRDYKVIINPAPPVVTASPNTLAFGNVTTSTSSVPVRFSVIAGENLVPAIGIMTLTCPTDYQVSTNGTTWAGTLSMAYTGGSFSARNLYIRFSPTSAGVGAGNIAITGGGLSTAVNIAVTGTGTAACTGTPTAGGAVITPTTGGTTTQFSLSLAGVSAVGDLVYQWQQSLDGGTTWANIPAGIHPTHTFTGIYGNTEFRCIVTCGTGASAATSATASVTYVSGSMAASSCSPNFSSASLVCSTYGMWMRFSNFTGESGTIADATSCDGSSYQNLTSSYICTVNAATPYTATLATGGTYSSSLNCTVWIDFDNDGSFTSTEIVGGFTSGTLASGVTTGTVTVTIPGGAPTGLFRMRLISVYSSPVYPTFSACGSTSYGSCRDYSVFVNGSAPPCSGMPAAGILSYGTTSSCDAFKTNLFNVGETGEAGITFAWQSSSSPTTGFTDIAGATNAVYQTPDITTVGTTYYRNTITCGSSTSITSAVPVTLHPNADVSDFSPPTATNSCSGSGSTVTVTSTSLGTGTFTATYDLSGANSSTGNTATLVMTGTSGTFDIPNSLLGTLGTTDVTITQIATSAGCNGTLSSGNTATFAVGNLTDISNFTSPTAPTVCAGVSNTATVNSTSMGVGTYTVTFSVSGANSSTGNTATLTMGASNGTFMIDGSLLTSSGSTTMTINSITNASGCTVNLSGSNTATFNVNNAAAAFTMTGGGSYCAGGTGVAMGISTSTAGNDYQLYNGAGMVGTAVGGTGSAFSFGTQTASGTYTVLATNTGSGCTIASTGTAVVNITPPPSTYSVTGGGSYCAGGAGVNIGLSNSDLSVLYSLYLGSTPVATVTGTGGAPVGFGLQTGAGTYIVIANPGTACATSQAGSATVVINALPTAYAVTGGGDYCAGGAGSPVGVSFGATGVLYNLKMGAATISTAAGTNAALSFGNQTTVGTYSVEATIPSTGCTNDMAGTVTVGTVTPPAAQTVTGSGNACAGGTGVPVGLASSEAGVSYQLYSGATTIGSTVPGTAGAISFGSMTSSGVYTVLASSTTSGVTCTTPMTGNATVIINAAPTVFTVTGGGGYCSGGTGVAVGLNGSSAGTDYKLYNSAGTLMSTVSGTGSAISFGEITAASTYTVSAVTPATTCTANMSGAAVVTINSLPSVYSVGGGGNLCTGGTGWPVTLSGSQTSPATSYQLYQSGIAVGGPLAGTGGGLNFGTFTSPGIYTILATNVNGCQNMQSGSATINVNPLPNVYPITGGGNYCAGSTTGVTVGLGGAQSGITYQLYAGATFVGSVTATSSAPITFPGTYTLAGTYTAYALNASTTCANNMSGTVSVGINPLPTPFGVTGTGSYCAGGSGIPVGVSSSTPGTNYTLYNGATPIGTMAGTGSAITFVPAITAAGTYTVSANTPSTGCNGNMAGSAVVSVNALPLLQTVTSSGTNYCAGGAGITIGLGGSESTVTYQLYNGSSPSGAPVTGTGGAISFGTRTLAGTYTVQATNSTTLCTRNMTGSASVTMDPLPTVFGVTGGGSYCANSTGVNISLGGSQSGVSYQLYNGASMVGGVVPGTGAALSFGTHTTSGTYTVLATNTALCTSNQSGAATVVMNALPTAYTITSSGTNYCAGTSGITIGLSNSATGVNYQLYNGPTPVGSLVAGTTGSAISFGAYTASGTYTAVGIDAATGCSKNMTGSAAISINPAPAVYNVTGGGNYCATTGATGVSIGLSGSNSGINYQLYNGSLAVGAAMAGTGAALTFGTYTTSGTYVVVASNGTTSCTSNMAGSATVVINPLPTVYAVTGGGSYCNGGAGLHIGLGGSTAGIAYQLYNGSTPIGSLVSGTGLSLDFGVKTDAGTYTVLGYNPATTCSTNMLGSALITVNSLPTIHTVTGGGSYCNGSATGVNIGLSNSTPGTSYQLYNGSATAGGPVFGTGAAIDFGGFTGTGTYSVLATSVSTSCTNAMSGTAVVSVSALPVVQTVTGGGTICQGSTGANIYLNNSSTGVNYQLYNGPAPIGAPVPGTGTALSFGPQTAAGTYTITATNATTGCMRNMSGSASIVVNAQPVAQTVTGGGNYCSGDVGVMIGLGASASGISYQLFNGTTSVGSAVIGTGGAITFGLHTNNGNYTVVGTNTSTGCSRTMTGSATVTTNSLPTAYTVSGGGSFCNGGAGVGVALSGSNTGVSYQLMNGSTPVGLAVTGTGGPLSFGLVSASGTYMVVATNAATCSNFMTGSATVNMTPLPTAYVVSGGGDYCSGGAGVEVSLMGSNTGISYQLYNGGMLVGSPVAGNGGAISFGNQMAAGTTYSVLATNTATTCTNAMSGSVSVGVNALPTAHPVSGGGTICQGATGAAVVMGTSTPGIEYQLYSGSTPVGPVMIGTGVAMDFGPVGTPGTYMVVANNPATSCSRNMSGMATVVVNALPVAQTVTGGGSFCGGGTGVAVGLAGSATGISYQLMNGSTAVGSAVAGTGSAISFGLQTGAGVYTVGAVNNTTTCSNTMTGSATVSVNTPPNAYSVLSMGSSYCAGGEGVHVLLSGSDGSTDYTLMVGGTAVGSPMSGTGGALDFGAQTAAGIYTIVANNTANSCTRTMTGSAAIVINPLPNTYAVTGGGGYCSGTAGADVYLAGSNAGISYQLWNGSTAVGSPVVSVGGPISFGPQLAGTYQVIATNPATTCTNNMTGSVVASVNASPTVYAVTGGGAYCAGGAGSEVGLANSSTGVTYQLYRNGSAVGTAVAGSTGLPITFGMQVVASTMYTVKATNTATSCLSDMSGTVSVSINTLPTAQAVSGGGSICAGAAGVNVSLGGSSTGVNYQLYNGTTPVTGAVMAGTGGGLSFGPQATGGNYVVMATSTSNGCTSQMTGSATVVVNPLPTAYTVTGGGSYCATPGATGVAIGLSSADAGISYQLYKDGIVNGSPVTGSGPMSFGMRTASGNYTVMAMNSATTCSSTMTGSATVMANAAVTPAVTVTTDVGNAVCLGVLTTFTATSVNEGATPTYQWKVNGTNVGLGFSTYAYVPSNGDVVSVAMTSSENCASPATATGSITMSVSNHETPKVTVTATPGTTVCQGTAVTYNVTPEFGGAAPSYIWKKNGATVGTGTSYSYTPSNNDVITVEMTSNFPCRLADKATTEVTMNVEAPVAPVVSIAVSPMPIVPGQNVTLTVTAANANGTPTFRWLINGVAVPSAVTNVFTSNDLKDGDEVTVEVTSHGACLPMMGSKTITIDMAAVGVATVLNTASDIRLLPNPNNGDFIIRGTTGVAGDQELNAQVTDVLGQVVFRSTVMSRGGTIDQRVQIGNTLANGMYILTLRSETETKTFHFIVRQ